MRVGGRVQRKPWHGRIRLTEITNLKDREAEREDRGTEMDPVLVGRLIKASSVDALLTDYLMSSRYV